jgi:hypothetical protein
MVKRSQLSHWVVSVCILLIVGGMIQSAHAQSSAEGYSSTDENGNVTVFAQASGNGSAFAFAQPFNGQGMAVSAQSVSKQTVMAFVEAMQGRIVRSSQTVADRDSTFVLRQWTLGNLSGGDLGISVVQRNQAVFVTLRYNNHVKVFIARLEPLKQP